MKVFLISILLLGFSSCGKKNTSEVQPLMCTVKQHPTYAVIKCPDGSSSKIINGENGQQGIQGIQGEQGVQGEQGQPGEPGTPGTNGLNGQDGQMGPPGVPGNNGENGLSSYILASRSTTLTNCPSQTGTIISTLTGYDTNLDGILTLDVDNITNQSISFMCDGTNGTNGENGINGQNGVTTIVYQSPEVIYPCGYSQNVQNEVFFRIDSTTVIAYFESGANRHLSVLTPGNYVTTDGKHCNFTYTNDHQFIW